MNQNPRRSNHRLWLVLLLVGSSPLLAHQHKEATLSIVLNPRTQKVEISHRYYIHDAEHAFARIMGKRTDLIGDEKARAAFTDYVIKHFKFGTSEDQPVKLETVGDEIDNKFIWIYQEADLDAIPCSIWLKTEAFFEIWPDQIHHVNLEASQKVRSARLSKPKPDAKLRRPVCD